MDIDQIRRDSLSLWLRGARLPLTATEAVLKRGQDTTSWPPALAFEKAEVAVRGFVGNLTNDDVLVGLANLQRAEIEQREQALFKKAEAAATRTEVQQRAKAKEAQLEDEREQAEQAAKDREQRIQQDRREAEQRTEQAAAKKRAAARTQSQARTDAIDKAATKAEATKLRKEAEALRAKEKAVQAESKVLDLDKATRAKKAARKAG